MARPRLTHAQRVALDRRQRSRILGGLATCIGSKGYAATTIADIARAARVSKSTVYAHFDDKEDAFLALYSAASDRVIEVLETADAEAAAAGLPWRERVRAVLGAYLSAMAAGEDLTRCLLVEAQAVSPRALSLRREVLDRYARTLRRMAGSLAAGDPGLRVPSTALVLGVLGGVNEHMLRALAAGGPPRLRDATGAATELMCAVLVRPPE